MNKLSKQIDKFLCKCGHKGRLHKRRLRIVKTIKMQRLLIIHGYKHKKDNYHLWEKSISGHDIQVKISGIIKAVISYKHMGETTFEEVFEANGDKFHELIKMIDNHIIN